MPVHRDAGSWKDASIKSIVQLLNLGDKLLKTSFDPSEVPVMVFSEIPVQGYFLLCKWIFDVNICIVLVLSVQLILLLLLR